jgi:anti-sigma factor RsiW
LDCADVYNWLQAYLDAGVTAEQERAVEAHVRACPSCRRRLVDMARAVNALERSGDVSPRAEFTRRLYETLEREAGRPLTPPRPTRPPGGG